MVESSISAHVYHCLSIPEVTILYSSDTGHAEECAKADACLGSEDEHLAPWVRGLVGCDAGLIPPTLQ